MSRFCNRETPDNKTPLVEPPCFIAVSFRARFQKGLKFSTKIMEKFLNKCGPKDLLAIFVIIGAFFLKFREVDGVASMILIGICAAYFGGVNFIPQKTDVSTTTEPK